MESRISLMAKNNPNYFQYSSFWSCYCIFPNWIHSASLLFLAHEYVLFTFRILCFSRVDKLRIKKRKQCDSSLVIYTSSCLYCFIHLCFIHCPRYDDFLPYNLISIHSTGFDFDPVNLLRFF